MPKVYFQPLRITEEKMSNKEILETFNSAFGGEAVAKVTKSKNTRIIHIDQENEARAHEWEQFYSDLNETGSIWIKAKYLGDSYFYDCCFNYSRTPLPGYWEVHYARRKDGKLPAPVQPDQPKPKVCTCGCTCGARMGISI